MMVWRLYLSILIALLLTVGCASPTTDAHTAFQKNQEANLLYQEGKYAEALETYRQAQVKRPELPQLNFNAGGALYKSKEHDRAFRELQRSTSTDDKALQNKAHYNMGNSLVLMERLQEAMEEYKNALRINPGDVDAKYNLEYLQRLLNPQRSTEGGEPQERPGGQDGDSESPNGADSTPRGDAQGGAQGDGGSRGQGQDDTRARERELRRSIQQGFLDGLTIEEALRILDSLRELEENVQGKLDWSPKGAKGGGDKDW